MNNIEIRHVENKDKNFWFTLDKHLPEAEFYNKVRDKQGYVLFIENCPIGILRYNLFWDNIPFCTLLYIKQKFKKKGYGKVLMNYWEQEMSTLGHKWLLVSTQIDETAQHFYRAIGYTDCGELNVPNQSTELFLYRKI